MRLQLATISDFPALITLVESFYAHFEYPYANDTHEQMVAHFLANPHLGSFWLVCDGEDAVGYVLLANFYSFEFGGQGAFVDELFVTDTHRNRGLGSWALVELQRHATELGLVVISLQTEHYNTRAKKLYESLGFKDLKRSTLTWLNR